MSDIVINGTTYSGVNSISVKTTSGSTTKYTEGERPSGSVGITENGTYDVTNYATANVNIEKGIIPAGQIEITENGTHNVTNYASAVVNVPTPQPVLQEKTATENGEVVADAGFYGLSKVIVDVASSGGNDSGGKYLVRVIDYDGTILKQDHLNTGAVFALPEAPIHHERLSFQEWSSSEAIVDNTVTIADNDVIIGAIYTTKSGQNEFDISLTKATGLSIKLNMDGTKNWGDGTKDTSTTHTYSNYGDYTITCNGTTMTTSSTSGLFGQKSGSTGVNRYCTSVRLATVPSISEYALNYCSVLKNITISKTVTLFSNYSFQGCYVLKHIVIPSSVTSLGIYAFKYCYTLSSIVIPNSITGIKDGTFDNCYNLPSIVIPNSVTSLSSSSISLCYNLSSIIIPNNVTSIANYVFGSCYSLAMYDFSQHTTIPSLGGTSGFSTVCPFKIYVPDDLYDTWITATNWSSLAKYIYKASEMPAE